MSDKSIFHYHVAAGSESQSQIAQDLNRDGVVVIPSFADAEEVKRMKDRMQQLIELWDPSLSKGSVFHTYGNANIREDYFLESASTIRFFLEPGAVDETGAVRTDLPKGEMINKVGHALHFLDPVFSEYSQSDKVKKTVKDLGYIDPVLPQSMYIFKQGKIGGEVTAHQDSTFLYTTPRQTCLGMWLALDDADVHNGCLWARKGSHKEPLRTLFQRTTDENGKMVLKNCPIEDNGDVEGSSGHRAREWVNIIPGGNVDYCEESVHALKEAGYEALPVKAGDLVCFPGTLDHLSLSNKSPAARHTFQLHLVEGTKGDVTWGKENWMQYPLGLSFPSLGLDPGA